MTSSSVPLSSDGEEDAEEDSVTVSESEAGGGAKSESFSSSDNEGRDFFLGGGLPVVIMIVHGRGMDDGSEGG